LYFQKNPTKINNINSIECTYLIFSGLEWIRLKVESVSDSQTEPTGNNYVGKINEKVHDRYLKIRFIPHK
jgi:hypothetical protein